MCWLTFVSGENASQHTSTIFITQGTELEPGMNNRVGFYQTDGAWAEIIQYQDNNTALLWQDGNHSAWITQDGNENHAEIQQFNSN